MYVRVSRIKWDWDNEEYNCGKKICLLSSKFNV